MYFNMKNLGGVFADFVIYNVNKIDLDVLIQWAAALEQLVRALGMRKVGCLNAGHDEPKLLEQVVTTPLPKPR